MVLVTHQDSAQKNAGIIEEIEAVGGHKEDTCRKCFGLTAVVLDLFNVIFGNAAEDSDQLKGVTKFCFFKKFRSFIDYPDYLSCFAELGLNVNFKNIYSWL